MLGLTFPGWFGLLIALLATGCATRSYHPQTLGGVTFIHDPSTIVQEGDRYYCFGTGPGISSRSSRDLIHWESSAPVFRQLPDWTWDVSPQFDGRLWAPDIIRLDGRWFLYYSVSGWGKQDSAIGLATSPALRPGATNHVWTDAGRLLASTNGSPYNTIDPSVMQDVDGRVWLTFGSFWKGIYLTELDPHTGKLLHPEIPAQNIAWNDAIEASCLTRHGDDYYLFVNWGRCCQGTNSTYEIRVGRAHSVTGPYLDREGKDLLLGGGTPFLRSQSRFIGPGHVGILEANGGTWFSYHYYDAATQGRSRLALGKIDWSDDWPHPAP
jgi:arabinan endo-1,5-alpha-L-arabinosidase